MKKEFTMIRFLTALAIILVSSDSISILAASQPSQIIKIWPDSAPDETREIGEETDTTTPDDNIVDGRRVMRIGNVSSPELHYYPAPEKSANGTSVIIFPGGGYHILAWDLEGTEVAEWLNSIGVNAWVLKYRVPRRQNDKPWWHALQDAQRSISLVRQMSAFPDRIGVLGFSAGGNLAFLSGAYNGERIYTDQDETDKVSWRPDFCVLVYPAWLTQGDGIELAPHFEVTGNTPPMFFAHAADDPVSAISSVAGFVALKKAGVGAEVHIYPNGGHGYGMRRTDEPVTTWPDRCTDWMRRLGLLTPPSTYVPDFAAWLYESYKSGSALPSLSSEHPNAGLDQAYAIQTSLVGHFVKDGKTISGFKGGASSAAAQETLGIDSPLSAVLFKSGWLQASSRPRLALRDHPNLKIETEIGFIVGEAINTRVGTVRNLKRKIKSIVPVIELPGGPGMELKNIPLADMIARNAGSHAYIVGSESPASKMDPDSVFISLKNNEKIVNVSRGDEALGGQWLNLLHQVNHAIESGHNIEPGQIIITGALGRVLTAEPGNYSADFGDLGSIEFSFTE